MGEVHNLPILVSGRKRKSLSIPTVIVLNDEETPKQRIHVGSNQSQVQRALKSQAFNPLPPESPEEEYEKIIEASTKSAEFTPVSIKQQHSLPKRSSQGLRSLSHDERASAGFRNGQNVRKSQTLNKKSQKHWGDDTLERIDRVVDAGIAVTTNPLEVLGRTVRNMTDEAYNDWLEAGEQSKIGKKAYKEAYATRKSEVRREKRQQAIEKSESDAKYQAEMTFGERRFEDAKKAYDVSKKVFPVVKKAAKAGFGGVKTTIRAVGEIVEEFDKTPIARNLKAQAEADYRHMKSGARRARGSIAETGKKRYPTRSSLNKPKTFGTTTKTDPYGIVGLYERGAGGRTELHFYRGKNRITHSKVAKILTHRQIQETKKAAILGQQPVQYQAQAQKHQAPFAVAQTTPVLNVPNTHSSLAKKRVTNPIVTPVQKTFSGLTKKRAQGNPILNIPKIATPSRLARKTHSGVV